MEPVFSTRSDGVIDIDLGPEWPGLTATLMDAVTTRAPRGSDGICPSTYWIDQALESIAQGAEGGTGKPFLWGNATELLRNADRIVARSQYEVFEDESIPLSDFVQVLRLWRERVTAALEGA